MQKSFFFLAILAGLFFHNALSRANDLIEKTNEVFRQVDEGTLPPSCDQSICGAQKPSCEYLSDSFCEKLWDPKNEGNLENGTSRFFLGNTGKSEMSHAKRMNYYALLDGANNLPSELNAALKPLFSELRAALSEEEDSKPWYRKIGDISRKINWALQDMAREKTFKDHPELKNKREKDYTVIENSYFTNNQQILENQILEAKYQKHPNWLNAKKIAQKAKKDLIIEINKLKIPDSYKARMIKKLKSVEISLPYGDPKILSNWSDCGEASINAFYTRRFNKITMCAGIFNTMQSEGTIYKIMAHEFAHSIDPSGMCEDNYKQTGTRKIIETMYNAKGNTFDDCTKWKKIINENFSCPKKIEEPGSPLKDFTNCLVDRSRLKPFKTESVREVASRQADGLMSSWASNHDFIRLTTPMIKKGTEEEPNEFYLRPDILNLNDNKFYKLDYNSTYIPTAEIFVQTLKCPVKENICPKDKPEHTPEETPEGQKFKDALDNTRDIIQGTLERMYSQCGIEEPSLAEDRLSKTSSENFADWLANKAMIQNLSQMDSLKDKRKFAQETGALCCDAPGTLDSAPPEFRKIEKTFSFAVHGDNRIRRLSVLTPEISDLIQCQSNESLQKGFGSCKL